MTVGNVIAILISAAALWGAYAFAANVGLKKVVWPFKKLLD